MTFSGSRRPAILFVTLLALASMVAACDSTSATPSPVYTKTDLLVGTGTEAASGNMVKVNYTGWFYDASKSDKKGLVFDTNAGTEPFVFMLGSGTVIDGWEQGVPGMKVGGIRRLVVPPSLAYGQTRYSSIPPNATLVFEIELLEVQ